MLLQKNYPVVFVGSVNESISALSFGRDEFACELTAATERLFFGRFKPFSAIYIEMGVANTDAQTLFEVDYWNGSAWVSLPSLVDDTKGFMRSGFVQFDKPEDWVANTVSGIEQYYIRFKASEDFTTGTTVQGINIVFSDDEDLRSVYPGVINYKHSTESSFILRHEAARDRIVQDVRNRGFRKVTGGTATMLRKFANYEAWDLMDIAEVKDWSKYLTLENIFSSLQSTEDGLYKQKAEEYRELAGEARAAFWLTLDRDDDGITSAGEASFDISTRRLVRR